MNGSIERSLIPTAHLRKIARDKQLMAHLMANAVDHYLHTEEFLQAKETQQLLDAVIDKLPTQGKKVFTLCKLEGKSHEETSRPETLFDDHQRSIFEPYR